MGSQVSGAEALNIRPDLALFPKVCTLPSPSTAILATAGQEEHVMVRKKKKKEKIYRLGDVPLLTEVQATSNSPSVPAPAVASPALFKHSFLSETPWSLTADHLPQLLPPLPC